MRKNVLENTESLVFVCQRMQMCVRLCVFISPCVMCLASVTLVTVTSERHALLFSVFPLAFTHHLQAGSLNSSIVSGLFVILDITPKGSHLYWPIVFAALSG